MSIRLEESSAAVEDKLKMQLVCSIVNAIVNATDVLFLFLVRRAGCAQTRLCLYEGLRSTFWPSQRKQLAMLQTQPCREGGNLVEWEG